MTRINENKAFKSHLITALQKEIRFDNRKKLEHRNPKVEIGVVSKAEGSCRVTMGNTVVLAGTKLGIEKPYPDRPDQGSISVNTELLPLSSPDFETGPPGIQSIEMARVVDRTIREGGAIDFSKLVIKRGEKTWFVFIDIVSMNDDGNLMDAAALAAMGALLNTHYPKVDKEGLVDYKTPDKPLKVEALPVLVTVCKIGDQLFVDPLKAEEPYIEARLSVGSLEDGTVCALQKGGETPFTEEEIAKALDIAVDKAKGLRKLLKGGKTGKR